MVNNGITVADFNVFELVTMTVYRYRSRLYFFELDWKSCLNTPVKLSVAKKGLFVTPLPRGGNPASNPSPKSGKEKTHKHKQICGIVPELGGCHIFCLCLFLFFLGSFLMGRKTQKQNPPKIPGQSREKLVVFCSLCVLFAPPPPKK